MGLRFNCQWLVHVCQCAKSIMKHVSAGVDSVADQNTEESGWCCDLAESYVRLAVCRFYLNK